MALSNQFAMQKVFSVKGFDIETGELLLTLKKMKETTFTNGQETVWVTGSDSRIASFDHSKTAMLSGASALISDELLALQTGEDVKNLSASTLFEYEDTLTITSNVATTTYTATGTAGAEVGFAYILDANGSSLATLTQDAAATPTKFTYTSGTKALTFFAGAYPDGTKVRVVYHPTASSLKKVQSGSQTFAKTVRIVADCKLKDACNDKIIFGQLKADKGKISGAFEWSLTDGGEATVHNFECEFLESCDDDILWELLIVDPDDLS